MKREFTSIIVAAALATLVGTIPASAHHDSAAPFPLGTFTSASSGQASCPGGSDCSSFFVDCPGVRDSMRGYLATGDSVGATRGVVMFFSSGGGTDWWEHGGQFAAAFLDDLRADGMTVVQVRWEGSWLNAASGEDAGPAHLACRSATVIDWVHDHHPLPAHAGRRCGFCLTGNSGGASQISYALTHYSRASIVDRLVPTGGPPHAAIYEGCIDGSGPEAHTPNEAAKIDASYGFLTGAGPCATHNASWAQRWREESVNVGGTYLYPGTDVRFVIGDRDDTSAPALADFYIDKLRAAGTDVEVNVVAGMPHSIQSSADGMAALRAALLVDSVPPGASPPGSNEPGSNGGPPQNPASGSGTGSGPAPGSPGAHPSSSTPSTEPGGGSPEDGSSLEAAPDQGPLPSNAAGWAVWGGMLAAGIAAGFAGTFLLRRRMLRRRPQPPPAT